MRDAPCVIHIPGAAPYGKAEPPGPACCVPYPPAATSFILQVPWSALQPPGLLSVPSGRVICSLSQECSLFSLSFLPTSAHPPFCPAHSGSSFISLLKHH